MEDHVVEGRAAAVVAAAIVVGEDSWLDYLEDLGDQLAGLYMALYAVVGHIDY